MTTNAKIVLIEDEKNICSFIERILAPQGYQVISAPTGQKGLELIHSLDPDLILLDLGLPDMDGLAIIEQVRSRSAVPIIVVSARTMEKSKVAALDMGADDYITKPFGTAELMARIRTALRHRKEHPGFKNTRYEVEDLMAWKVDALLDEIYSGTDQTSYTLDTDGMEEEAAQAAEACASRWDKAAKNGSIDSYDAENGEFTFAGEEEGFAIDQEKLAQDILAALEAKDFDAEIEAEGSAVAPEITAAQAKEQYKTLSSLTTKTTANSNRNTNIRLAAQAINGTIVKPGEEFSFNGTVGQRTEAKGYKGAAAYNNGEVVQEIGGGVCQVSTTLYGAVFRAGLEITYRRSHTFEPNYITPGQDATVSWEQPDFKFRNNSSAAIGIRASYSNQKMTVSIYGIPILEEGVTWDLESKKTEDVAPPAPTYEEDQTLQPGVEVVKSAGSMGSRWETYKVVYKDGVEVSRELDHRATYKGHAPVIQRNTTGIVLPPEETTTSAETPVQTVDGMPEGYVPSSSAESGGPGDPSQGDVNSGPGVETTAAPPSATAPAETLPAGPGEGSAAPAESPQESEKTDAMVIAPLDPQA